jgi:hypothetical protein
MNPPVQKAISLPDQRDFALAEAARSSYVLS